MKIDRYDDFGGAVLNCAVRYALGRASYMPGLVMDVIRPMLPSCSDKTLWCFDRDINEWLSGRGDYADVYERDWLAFATAVQAEMNKRKEAQP